MPQNRGGGGFSGFFCGRQSFGQDISYIHSASAGSNFKQNGTATPQGAEECSAFMNGMKRLRKEDQLAGEDLEVRSSGAKTAVLLASILRKRGKGQGPKAL
jgi:hypothetical protein